MRLRADRCELPSGKVIEPYYVMEETEWVHAAVFDTQNRLLLIRQYRYAGDAFGYELPGGTTDPGEDLLVATQRELLEETGCVADDWRHVAAPFANPARQNNRVHCYLARNVRKVAEPELEETEQITSVFKTVPEVLELIRVGEINQAVHVGLIHLAFMELGFLQLNPTTVVL